MQPYGLTRPYVGRSPVTPHVDAGDTIDPFVSVPTAKPRGPRQPPMQAQPTSRSRQSLWSPRVSGARADPQIANRQLAGGQLREQHGAGLAQPCHRTIAS
jgi:hypothetical protein